MSRVWLPLRGVFNLFSNKASNLFPSPAHVRTFGKHNRENRCYRLTPRPCLQCLLFYTWYMEIPSICHIPDPFSSWESSAQISRGSSQSRVLKTLLNQTAFPRTEVNHNGDVCYTLTSTKFPFFKIFANSTGSKIYFILICISFDNRECDKFSTC